MVQRLVVIPVAPVLVELQLTEPFAEYRVSVTPLLVAEQDEPELPPEGRGKLDVLGCQILSPRLLMKRLRLLAPLTCNATTPTIATSSTPATARIVFLLLFCIAR
jgi:hypothetical protein